MQFPVHPAKKHRNNPKPIRGHRTLPPVPNFNDASVCETIAAELAQQEAVLEQLQIMEQLYAEELELGKLLSRLELEDKPEPLPISKTAPSPDELETLPMVWDDPSHGGWAPPVEPLLEDASRLEADSWKELGLHPYDDEECEEKPKLQRAVQIDPGACEAMVRAPATAAEAPEPEDSNPTATVGDVDMDGVAAKPSAPDSEASDPTAMDDVASNDDAAPEAESSNPVADGVAAELSAPESEPSDPTAMAMDDAAADGAEAPSALAAPACLQKLRAISPAEQSKLVKPDKDPNGRGRSRGRGRGGRGRGRGGRGKPEPVACDRSDEEEHSEHDSEDEMATEVPETKGASATAKSKALPKRKAAAKKKPKAKSASKKAVADEDDDGATSGEDDGSKKQIKRRCAEDGKSSAAKKVKRAMVASEEDSAEADSFEAGFRCVGGDPSPASKRTAIQKAGGSRRPKSKSAKKLGKDGDRDKKPDKAGGCDKNPSKTKGGDCNKKPSKTKGGDCDKKPSKTKAGDCDKKPSKTKGGDCDKKPSKTKGGDCDKKPSKTKAGDCDADEKDKAAETKARLSRKSCAYHKARAEAKANGASDEQAKEAAKKVPDSWQKAVKAFDKELTELVSIPEPGRAAYNGLVQMDTAGAPAIASAGGVFVAGNATTQPEETLIDTQNEKPIVPRALSFDSAWRADELESPPPPKDSQPVDSKPPPECTAEGSKPTPTLANQCSPSKANPSPKKVKHSPKKSKHSPLKPSPKKSKHSPLKPSPKKSRHSPLKSSPKKSTPKKATVEGESDSPLSTPASALSRGASTATLGSRSSGKTRSSSKFDKYYHQMRRTCKPTNGPTKASKEALQLWGSESGREKLRKLLIEKGTFKEVELHLAKYKSHVEKDATKGRWVTKAYLMEKCGYTRLLGCSLTSKPHKP
ncbi:unnamed protein product [Symbiodinium sp. CCMP2592]|nr:unnamed protein product [Symbiodinium sp. CCMP2592]